jgi:hypothetical protein
MLTRCYGLQRSTPFVFYELGQSTYQDRMRTKKAKYMLHMRSLDKTGVVMSNAWLSEGAGTDAHATLTAFVGDPMIEMTPYTLISPKEAKSLGERTKTILTMDTRQRTYASIQQALTNHVRGQHRDTKLRSYARWCATPGENRPHLSLEVPSWRDRAVVTALRLGVLDIAIEADRIGMDHNSYKYQSCRLCDADDGVIKEDEVHFLFVCPRLHRKRIKYLKKLYRVNPNINLSSESAMVGLLKSDSLIIHKIIADMAMSLLHERGRLLVTSRFARRSKQQNHQ